MKEVSVQYTTKTQHKHSVRMTPRDESEMRLPDLYITHDVLDALEIDYRRSFELSVTFTNHNVK